MLASETAQSLLFDLLKTVKELGADAADARVSEARSVSVDVRMGKLEALEQSESTGVALRVFIGQRQASVGGSDLSPQALKRLAERCVAMARLAPEDPYAGITPADELARNWPDLGLGDGAPVEVMTLEAAALVAEDAARAVEGIVNSNGAGASYSRSRMAVAASNGFYGLRESAGSGLGVSVVAARDGQMERDYAGRGVRDWADLPAPEEIGREAGERASARVGARKIDSQKGHVIFERRLSASLIGALIEAIKGPAIARGVSFMKSKLGEQVLPRGLSVLDDPFRAKGLASRPFDGEGRAVAPRALIDDGVLTEWLLNGASAKQLGLKPNSYASFGFGDPPGVTTSNVHLTPGGLDLAGLMAEAKAGLLVTDMFGPSLNQNTGDYSVGVSGFWFEGGERAYPVNEVTVAGSLPEFLARIVPGSDLLFESSTNVPSLLIPDVSLAGR